jgi:hypothetical protein
MRLMLAIAAVAAAPLVASAQTPPPAETPPAAAAPAAPPAAAPAMNAAPEAAPPAAPAAPPAPPPPPAPPTDPTAIAVLGALQNVCVPAVEGGALDKLAKSGGFRKSGDNFVQHGPGYSLTIWPAGSNPGQCHVDIVHPVDPAGPGAPIIVALHNWAAGERGYTLYQNGKRVENNQELTVRSWEHDDPGKHEAMFMTTYRRADGAPMRGNADTSTLVYSETKTGG